MSSNENKIKNKTVNAMRSINWYVYGQKKQKYCRIKVFARNRNIEISSGTQSIQKPVFFLLLLFPFRKPDEEKKCTKQMGVKKMKTKRMKKKIKKQSNCENGEFSTATHQKNNRVCHPNDK